MGQIGNWGRQVRLNVKQMSGSGMGHEKAERQGKQQREQGRVAGISKRVVVYSAVVARASHEKSERERMKRRLTNWEDRVSWVDSRRYT